MKLLVILIQIVGTFVCVDAGIPNRVSDMLRDAASATEDSDLVQRAVQMCGYKYCDPQYDCVTQTSDLFCKLFCQTLKNLEICDQNDPCSPSPCLNNGVCTSDRPDDFTCSCSEEFYGPTCQYALPPDDVIVFAPDRPTGIELWNLTSKERILIHEARVENIDVDWTQKWVFFSYRRPVYGDKIKRAVGIYRANLEENSDVTTVIKLETDVEVTAISLDVFSQIIYYIANRIEIRRISSDGSSVDPGVIYACEGGSWTVQPSPSIKRCSSADLVSLVVDPLHLRVYFSEDYRLSSCNTDGSDYQVLVENFVVRPGDMVIDLTGRSSLLFLAGLDVTVGIGSLGSISSFDPDTKELRILLHDNEDSYYEASFLTEGIALRKVYIIYRHCHVTSDWIFSCKFGKLPMDGGEPTEEEFSIVSNYQYGFGYDIDK